MTSILNLLKSRTSIRNFRPSPIPENIISEMLEAGRLAPSGGNEQPWQFWAITNPALIDQISEQAYQQHWIKTAPLLIVLCTTFVDEDLGGMVIQHQRFPELRDQILTMDRDLYWALNQEEHQTKIAGTQMVLAAWEHGVGSCWVSRFHVKAVAGLLNLPNGVLPAEILVFGYPQQEKQPTPKKRIEDIVVYRA